MVEHKKSPNHALLIERGKKTRIGMEWNVPPVPFHFIQI